MASSKKVIAFDLYGTLLSTESIADELAKIYGGDKAQSLATYKTFSEITRNALTHAVAEHGMTLIASDADKLMTAYDALHCFPEIPDAMKLLQENKEAVHAYIFSNGTDDMIGSSVRTSPELSPYADLFKSLITVDGLKCFKPDPRTYAHLVEQSGKRGKPGDVWVVSANPFDVVGAKASGLKTAFIDRQGQGWLDRLDLVNVPTLIASGVDEAT
ncbi:hypothetical protein NPX13_g10725 [Xylaria arbuscula]|uniref:Haloacid dehalogenase n=1 Tax=Xylaria arbuscula TaxID=114810 RepID=A0A9W8N4H9_9PEZI|nr:hypothetical protein NPX13_g10725 [Xylaria arbuscula]